MTTNGDELRPNHTTARFSGLCFTVVQVRYLGPTNHRGARWSASLYRGVNDVTRVIDAYDSSRASGAANALPAALACFTKARKSIGEPTNLDEWVAIPGELNADSYVFTFVPTWALS